MEDFISIGNLTQTTLLCTIFSLTPTMKYFGSFVIHTTNHNLDTKFETMGFHGIIRLQNFTLE